MKHFILSINLILLGEAACLEKENTSRILPIWGTP